MIWSVLFYVVVVKPTFTFLGLEQHLAGQRQDQHRGEQRVADLVDVGLCLKYSC